MGSPSDRITREGPTQRPLPWDDASVDALTERQRQTASRLWAGRAAGERQTALTFAHIERALLDVGASTELVALARRAIDDERRHAALCLRVASRYLGANVPALPPGPFTAPAHPGAPREILPSLHIIGQCAVNETTASAYLHHCLDHATAPLARAALRELMADEIDHARIGWAHLASAASTPEGRAALEPWLVSVLSYNFAGWTSHAYEDPGDALLAHGLPTTTAVRAVVIDAMKALIVPGFEHVGLDTRETRRWLDAIPAG